FAVLLWNFAVFLRQHRTIVECAPCLSFHSQICRKTLEIRQYSCGFPNKFGSKITAQSAHPYYAVLP
ncbi:MAG: hypothetical protein MJ077_10090, partial [Oscillospiraceae bacterium]|nr:hypothetical protein [Oscillospiraceae bacterium]